MRSKADPDWQRPHLKQCEVDRFMAAEPDWAQTPDQVTEWEHREYFTRY